MLKSLMIFITVILGLCTIFNAIMLRLADTHEDMKDWICALIFSVSGLYFMLSQLTQSCN